MHSGHNTFVLFKCEIVNISLDQLQKSTSHSNSPWQDFLAAWKVKVRFLQRCIFCTRLMVFQWFWHMWRATLGCHGAKPLIVHRFYKQNEIACILVFGVLEGLAGALRQSRFASCFKTPARIKIRRLHVTFLALVPVGSEIGFRRRSDLQVAQNEFFQNCRNSTNINEHQSTCQVFDLL